MLLRTWRATTVLLVSLLQGLAFAHLLERPAKLQYDAALYLMLQKTLYVQWGPPHVGGVLEPAAIAATLVLAFLLRKDRRALWLTVAAGIALLFAFPVVFFWLVAPANEFFLTISSGSAPDEWTAMRTRWELGHAIRFILQFFALGALVLSLILDTGET